MSSYILELKDGTKALFNNTKPLLVTYSEIICGRKVKSCLLNVHNTKDDDSIVAQFLNDNINIISAINAYEDQIIKVIEGK